MNLSIQSNTFEHARIANDTIDYKRLNLDESIIQPREDGMRTDGNKGSYEWWYVDAKFEDGSSWGC